MWTATSRSRAVSTSDGKPANGSAGEALAGTLKARATACSRLSALPSAHANAACSRVTARRAAERLRSSGICSGRNSGAASVERNAAAAPANVRAVVCCACAAASCAKPSRPRATPGRSPISRASRSASANRACAPLRSPRSRAIWPSGISSMMFHQRAPADEIHPGLLLAGPAPPQSHRVADSAGQAPGGP